jgi:AcrR family transcriptional regulator
MSSDTSDRPRRRAPRGTLNRDVIVAAAIKVLDTDGLDALTTTRLGHDLGVRPMSLYAHFTDKEAILRAVAVELFSRFEIPQSAGSDRELLRELMRSYFRLLVENPALVLLDALVDETNDAEARFTESIYGCFQRLGIDNHTAVGLTSTFTRFIVGSAALYPSRSKWDENPDYWKRQRHRLAALPAELYPAVHDIAQDFPVLTQQETFEFGLQTLLTAVDTIARR